MVLVCLPEAYQTFPFILSMFAELEFGDNEMGLYTAPKYVVVKYSAEINRTYDCCLPHADPRCRAFEIVVNSPDKTDLNLVEWYIDGSQKNGRLTFHLSGETTNELDNESVVYFEDAYCSELAEHYDISGKVLRQLRLTIVPMSFKVCDIDFIRQE